MKNLLAILIFVLAAPLVRAQTSPYLLSYQGHVTDSTGAVIGASAPTNRTVWFKLYANVNSPTPLYAESQVVTISQGEFSVLIGNGAAITGITNTPLDQVMAKNDTVVLGVSVASNEGANPTAEISPRQQLVAGAYAFRAKVAESVNGGSITASNLAPGSVGNGAIASNGLDAVALKDTSIVTGKIADSAVTGGKIAGNTITASKLDTTTSSGIGVWTPVANSNNIFRGTGNVGIGESSPNVPLTFASATGEKISFYGNNGSGQTGIALTNTTFQFYIPTTARIGFGTGKLDDFSETMSIVPGAGVGIGTPTGSAPTSMLDVRGGIKASGLAGFGFNSGDTDGGIFSPSDGIVQVNTNGAQAIRVGYGTISAPTLAIGNDAIGGANNCLSPSFQAYAGNLGSSPGNELIMGNFGCHNANDLSLGISAYRNTPGNDWTTAAILLGMNVDASPRSGGWIALAPGGVGIGISAPSYPLEVQGSRNFTAASAAEYYYNSNANNGGSKPSNGTTYPVGIFCGQFIVGAGLVATSDERIKNVIGRSDAASDLAKLMQIEVTDYKYKDVVGQGAQPEKKVIAQQVEKVYPQAVGSNVGVVPDIYQQATMENGWVILATNLQIGDRVRLINDAGASVHEVREVAGGKFRTDLSTPNGPVFVFGREVKDLRFVDYEAISMLNVSATQELLRKVQALEARAAEREAQLSALEARMANIEARLPSGK